MQLTEHQKELLDDILQSVIDQEDCRCDPGPDFKCLLCTAQELQTSLKPTQPYCGGECHADCGNEVCPESTESVESMVPMGVVESAMHLIDGLVSKPNDINKILKLWNQGCIELYWSLIPFAEECGKLFKEGHDANDGGVPGVFDYEVSCEFGSWYGQYILSVGGAPTLNEARAKLHELNSKFWAQFEVWEEKER